MSQHPVSEFRQNASIAPFVQSTHLDVPRTHNLPVATELPGKVHLVAALGYAGIIATMWVTFSGYRFALFMVAISTVFAIVYFGLSGLLGITERKRHTTHPPQLSFADFLAGDFETLTGRIKGWEALVQVAIIPILLALGIVVIGAIIAFNR